VLADPKPEIFAGQPDGKSTVFQRHADRPDFFAAPLADLLELQGRVLRIGFQQSKLLDCPSTNFRGKGMVIVPKILVVR